MTLTTTLNRLRAAGACAEGYKILLEHVGLHYDPDAPIDLLTVLESNGSVDCLWALVYATDQEDLRIYAAYNEASRLAARSYNEALDLARRNGDFAAPVWRDYQTAKDQALRKCLEAE